MTTIALTLTYRILTPIRNRSAATCKFCGTHLPTDHGREIVMQSEFVGRVLRIFLCSVCFGPIKTAHEEFDSRFTITNLSGLPTGEKVTQSDWWKTLDREPEKKEPWKPPAAEEVLDWLNEGGNSSNPGNPGTEEQQ